MNRALLFAFLLSGCATDRTIFIAPPLCPAGQHMELQRAMDGDGLEGYCVPNARPDEATKP